MPTYNINGVTGPAGSPTEVGAPDLGALPAVSQSTPASLTPDVDSDGWEHAWWKITPAEAGARMVDATLSYDSDGVPLTSYVNVFTYDGTTYDFYDGTFGSGPIIFDAGVDYYLSVGRAFGDGDGSSRMVLRVGDVAVPGEWVQPDDQAWWQGGDFQGENLPHTTVVWPTYDPPSSFAGHHQVDQPFAGGLPGAEADAVACSWDKARQGDYATQFWTSDGTGSGDPSSPVCIPQDPGNGGGVHYVGAAYVSDTGGFFLPATENYQVWSATVRFWLTAAITALGPTGGLLAPDPGPDTVEYEADVPELLGVDAAPDETSHDVTDITVQWVGSAVDQDENPGGTWGPKQDTGQFIGGAGGPEGFSGDYTLPDFPPDPATSGAPDWTALPGAVIAAALASESSYDPAVTYAGGLRWVGLFPEQLTDTPPALATPTLSPPESLTDVRYDQVVAVRLRVRPPRYRFRPDPVLPEVGTSVPVERYYPRWDDLGASPSPRNYPPPPTRNYPVQP